MRWLGFRSLTARARQARALLAPVPTQIVSSEEYAPPPQTAQQREVEARLGSLGTALARRHGLTRRRFFQTAAGMAAAYQVMHQVYGPLFDAPAAEAATPELADARAGALKDQLVFDAHMHDVRDDPGRAASDPERPGSLTVWADRGGPAGHLRLVREQARAGRPVPLRGAPARDEGGVPGAELRARAPAGGQRPDPRHRLGHDGRAGAAGRGSADLLDRHRALRPAARRRRGGRAVRARRRQGGRPARDRPRRERPAATRSGPRRRGRGEAVGQS